MERRGFEDEANRQQHQRSNERQNGIVQPPPAFNPADEDASPNQRRRRNGIAGADMAFVRLAFIFSHTCSQSSQRGGG